MLRRSREVEVSGASRKRSVPKAEPQRVVSAGRVAAIVSGSRKAAQVGVAVAPKGRRPPPPPAGSVPATGSPKKPKPLAPVGAAVDIA